jgi:hypothetical protein
MRGRARSTDARVRHSAEGQAIFRRVFLQPLHQCAPGERGEQRPSAASAISLVGLLRRVRFRLMVVILMTPSTQRPEELDSAHPSSTIEFMFLFSIRPSSIGTKVSGAQRREAIARTCG